jgi:tRNA(Arg) A34 adenosine deaminase TadA
MYTEEDIKFLKQAINKAQESVALRGFPAGAIVVKNGVVIGEGVSIGNQLNDSTAHGEMTSIRDACKNIQSSDLSGSTLYASMQPCLMCFGASMWSSISRIVFACPKEKVSQDYYAGAYNIAEINKDINNRIELVHISELENDSLSVVKEWEDSLEK